MQITVTFRHVDPTPALRDHAEEQARSASQKYLRRPVDAHVILGVVEGAARRRDHAPGRPRHDVRQGRDARSLLGDRPRGRQARAPGAEAEGEAPRPQGRSGARATRRRPSTSSVLSAADRAAGRRAGGHPHASGSRRSRCRVEEARRRGSAASARRVPGVHERARPSALAVLYRRKDGDYGLIEPEGR